MTMEVRVAHALGREEAARRVREAAQRLDVAPGAGDDPGTCAGSLVKQTPFGAVEARWEAEDETVVVTVHGRPAFVPEETVRRLLVDGLKDVLGS